MDIKCFYIGKSNNVYKIINRLKFLNTDEQFKKEASRKYDKKINQTNLIGNKFVCKIYDNDKSLGYIEFTYITKHAIYIDGLYKENGKGIKIGSNLINHVIDLAKNTGIEKLALIADDDGSGKLYKYYYDIGFRCVDIDQMNINIEKQMTSTYNDFFSKKKKRTEMERADRNTRKCYSMVYTI